MVVNVVVGGDERRVGSSVRLRIVVKISLDECTVMLYS